MAKPTNNFFKIEMLILKILEKNSCYGYQITQVLKELTNDRLCLREGTLYPILYKLLDEGYITDEKVLYGKRMTRVYYHITDKGIEHLYALIKEYQDIEKCINTFLEWDGVINES